MNRSEELSMMLLRAEIYAKERIEHLQEEWVGDVPYAPDPEEPEEPWIRRNDEGTTRGRTETATSAAERNTEQ